MLRGRNAKMDAKKQEIRRALSGRLAYAENGFSVVRKPGMSFAGISDGADSLALLGMSNRTIRYKTEMSHDDMMVEVYRAMQGMGRVLALEEQPESLGVFCRYILVHPVVLVFGFENDQPVLRAFTARSLTAFLALRRGVKSFEKNMPSGALNRMGKTEQKEWEKTAAQEAKEAAKRAKEEKKAEKKAKKEKAKSEAAQKNATQEEPAPEQGTTAQEPEPKPPEPEATGDDHAPETEQT